MKRVQLTVAVLTVLACAGTAVAGTREQARIGSPAAARDVAQGDASASSRSGERQADASAAPSWIPGPWSPTVGVTSILDDIAGTLSYFRATGDGRDSALASGERSVAAGSNARAEGQLSSAYGAGSRAVAYGGLAAGANAQSTGEYATAVGNDAQAQRLGTTAVGAGARASGDSAVAIGGQYNSFIGWIRTVASGTHAVALGAGAQATGDFSAALGPNAAATGEFAAALGPGSHATGAQSNAIGLNSEALAEG
ncbi:MAG: hypothetical protein HOQ02_11155, partial [Lysobacter sp.]|nr:hypothetical protein [Lysobacter sp.]